MKIKVGLLLIKGNTRRVYENSERKGYVSFRITPWNSGDNSCNETNLPATDPKPRFARVLELHTNSISGAWLIILNYYRQLRPISTTTKVLRMLNTTVDDIPTQKHFFYNKPLITKLANVFNAINLVYRFVVLEFECVVGTLHTIFYHIYWPYLSPVHPYNLLLTSSNSSKVN